MANEIKCYIEADISWEQKGCHWEILDRTFYLKYEGLTNSPSLTYTLSYTEDGVTKEIASGTVDSNVTTVNYTKTLTWGDIQNLLLNWEALNSAKLPKSAECLYLTAKIKSGSNTFKSDPYPIKLPPKTENTNALTISLVTNNPGEVKCSWTQGTEVFSDNNATGYCVEIFHSPEGEENFTQLTNLGWRSTELATGKYYIEKISAEETTYPNVEGEITTFVFNKPNSELYIRTPEVKEFYFMPKELGIKPGDKYLFRVYPYNVYGTYWTFDEDGNLDLPMPGTLLTNAGTEHQGKVSKGIVRVKTDNGWVEGQVWVMTDNGWVQVEAVYAMQDGNWHEAT